MNPKELIKITKSFKILYIEDDPLVHESTKLVLENLFSLVDVAYDGKEGLLKYKEFYEKRKDFYDLVISDINMPNMDGIKMSKKILKLNKKQSILILSAYNDSDKLIKLIDLGVSNFIHKPIEMDTLFDILGKISKDILESRDIEKNFDEIKKINSEYNSIIKNYDKFVIATRTDLEGNFVDVSEAYETISGYTKEELLGRNANLLRHENTLDKTYSEMWSAIQDGRIWSGEIQNKKKNGESYWISSVVSPYMDDLNNVIGYNAISEDITEQKKIEALSLKLQNKNEKLKDLLDNTNQGFLSCSKEMLIEKDYSLKCEEILEKDLEKKDISALLFSNDYAKQDTFRFGFNLLINESDLFKQEQILSLMPKEHLLKNMIIKIEYKLLRDKRVMLVLTNITKNKKLEEQLENEKNVYRMIIAVIMNNNQFWKIKEDYLKFLEDLNSMKFEKEFLEENLPQILYSLHTFKGLFSQKELIYTPKAIHDLEDKIHNIIHKDGVLISDLEKIISKNNLKEELNKDIVLITNILGEEFMDQRSFFKININKLNEIENTLNLILKDENIKKESVKSLFLDIKSLRKHYLYDVLNSYVKQVNQLAQKFSKKIHKVDIDCNRDIFIDERISGFIKSLVHVFRNAIIHGIEEPNERVLNSKNEYGTISCSVKKVENGLIIEVEDDGRGLSFDLIKEKAISLNYEESKLDKKTLLHLIFDDKLSTYTNRNEYAGCGVGLGAVNEELKKIDGTCEVRSRSNQGLKLTFTIPFKKD